MTKKNDSLIVAILDRSGSMNGLVNDVIGGYNQLITEQRNIEGTAKVSLHLFDDKYETVYDFVDLNKVPKLTNSTYNVRGSTALLDAVGRTINSVGTKLSQMAEHDRPEHVIVMIFTDGFENASREFTKEQIADMVSHQEENYNWQFMFLGAAQDSWAAAQSFGFTNRGATFNYTNDALGTQSAYTAASSGLAQARSGLRVDLNS